LIYVCFGPKRVLSNEVAECPLNVLRGLVTWMH